MKTGMICLISEQLWPHLQGVLHVVRDPAYEALDTILLYHTAAEHASLHPARRFKKMLQSLPVLNGVKVELFASSPKFVGKRWLW